MGLARTVRSRAAFWSSVAARDAASFRAHGRNAALWCQRIWIRPASCDRIVMGFHDKDSATVIDADWDLAAEPLKDSPQIRFSRMHWEQGIPWEETGAYDYLLQMIKDRRAPVDGCLTREDVVHRYEALDRSFEQVKSAGCLRTQSELPGRSFRERGGVVMHIDRDSRPVFGCKGHHRLAMAQILGHPLMPAQVGVIHPHALASWRSRFTERAVITDEESLPPDVTMA